MYITEVGRKIGGKKRRGETEGMGNILTKGGREGGRARAREPHYLTVSKVRGGFPRGI